MKTLFCSQYWLKSETQKIQASFISLCYLRSSSLHVWLLKKEFVIGTSGLQIHKYTITNCYSIVFCRYLNFYSELSWHRSSKFQLVVFLNHQSKNTFSFNKHGFSLFVFLIFQLETERRKLRFVQFQLRTVGNSEIIQLSIFQVPY